MNKYARFRYQPCIPLGDDGRCCTASEKHAQLSRKAATEGMVLLKNEYPHHSFLYTSLTSAVYPFIKAIK